ncbi:serpin family protein [Mucilaginibacter sp. OK283]|jgi:serpin B|uniref:serpin family protein n=1 Tax=Mucilaginibacter sp. OK283 TaxID=1881049 RepID=UPI0008D84706|nr:serpin family protein [Mucilaginibacter sp. OK283]SEO48321.1 serpin B [Mucilaginibacter sp. OK283]
MIRKAITILSLSLVVITACKKIDSKPDNGKDLVLTTTEQQKVAADNAFTLKLFKAALNINGNDNLFISPLSVSMAIGMTSNGAAGQTLHDIRNTMDFNNFTEDQVNSYYHKMITELPQLDSKTTLKFANSIWYANNFTPVPAFLQTNSANYNARIESVDFKNAGTKDIINNWVSNATDGKIAKIIDDSTDGAIMYLINAIYFKSSWANKFDAAKTQKGTFYLPSGGTMQANFMNLTYTPLNISIASDARVLELPYNNNKFSMVILTPAGKSVQEYAAGLDSAKWQSLMAGLSKSYVDVSMPKFKFSYDTELKGVLSTLGMANAFSDLADFTRINAAGGLTITEVKHKAYIEVDEEGTTAAAVTSVTVGPTAVLSYNFKLDHPFIFAIREMKTGLVLFAGVVNDPTK